MADRPILFNGEMVRAILAGRKTQTRRPIRDDWWRCLDPDDEEDRAQALNMSPYGHPGDRLWVRETWAKSSGGPDDYPMIHYAADGTARHYSSETNHSDTFPQPYFGKWRPSIHMPRWVSRITLEVTGVRVERVQDISDADARAEGFPIPRPVPTRIAVTDEHGKTTVSRGQSIYFDARGGFCSVWEAAYAKRDLGWDTNPWAWVVEFNRVQP